MLPVLLQHALISFECFVYINTNGNQRHKSGFREMRSCNFKQNKPASFKTDSVKTKSVHSELLAVYENVKSDQKNVNPYSELLTIYDINKFLTDPFVGLEPVSPGKNKKKGVCPTVARLNNHWTNKKRSKSIEAAKKLLREHKLCDQTGRCFPQAGASPVQESDTPLTDKLVDGPSPSDFSPDVFLDFAQECLNFCETAFEDRLSFENMDILTIILENIEDQKFKDALRVFLTLYVERKRSSTPLTSRTGDRSVRPQGIFSINHEIGLDSNMSSLIQDLLSAINGTILTDKDGSLAQKLTSASLDSVKSDNSVTQLFSNLNGMMESIQSTSDSLNYKKIFSNFKNWASDFCHDNKRMLSCIVAFILVTILYTYGYISKSIYILFVTILAGYGIHKSAFEALKRALKEDGEKVAPQSIDFISPSLFSKLAGILVTGSIFKNVDLDYSWSELPWLVRDFDRKKKGVSDFCTFVIETISDCIEWCCKQCDLPNYLKLKGSGSYEVWEWIDTITSTKEEYQKNKNCITYEFAIRCRDHVKTGENLLRLHCKRDDDNYKLIQYHLNTLKPILDICRGLQLFSEGFRPQPLSIMIGGTPGIGKSTMFPSLCTVIGANIVPEDRREEYLKNPNKLFYNRVTENEYWDGYNNQPVCLFDDFGQSVDYIGATASPFWEFIRAVNTAPYNLHMSAIADKANTPFTSQVVICTTNCTSFVKDAQIKSIFDAKAFNRRIMIGIWCVPAAEYSQNNEQDPSKRIADLGKISNMKYDSSFSHMEFYVHDYSNGITNWANKMTFDDLADLCISTYNKNKGFFLETNESLREIARASLERRKNLTVPQSGIIDRLVRKMGIKNNEFDNNDFEFYDSLEVLVEGANLSVPSDLLTSQNIWASSVKPLYEALSIENTWQEVLDIGFPWYFKNFSNLEAISLPSFYAAISESFIPTDLFKFKESTDCNRRSDFIIRLMCAIHVFHNKLTFEVKKKSPLIEAFNVMRSNLPKFLTEKKTLLLTLAGGVGFVALLVKVMRPSTKEQSSKSNKTIVKRRAGRVISQSGDPQGSAITKSIFNRNILLVLLKYKSGRIVKIGSLLGVCGNLMIGPRHYINCFDEEDEGAKIILKPLYAIGSMYQIELECDTFVEMTTSFEDNEDFCFYTIPKRIYPKSFRDIRKYFVTKEHAEKILNEKNYQLCALSTPIYDGANCYVIHTQNVKARFMQEGKAPDPCTGSDLNEVKEGTWDPLRLHTALTYLADVDSGYCGSLLTVVDKSSKTSKLWGLHVLGTKTQGYARPVTREYIDNSINALKNCFSQLPDSEYSYTESLFKSEEEVPVPVVPQGVPRVKVDGFDVVAVVKKGEFIANKSDIIESPCYEVLKKTGHKFLKVIPDLSKCPQGGSDILEKSRYKYNQPVIPYNQPLLDIANAIVYKKILSSQDGEDRAPRILTFEESLMGFEGDESWNPISKSAKPGWPWEQLGFSGSKKKMFGDYEWDLELPGALAVRDRYETCLRMYKERKRPFFAAKVFPKDERRNAGKVLRYISGYEVTLCLLIRSYFGDFCRMIYRGRNNHGIAIGVNAYGEDWHLLAKRHKQLPKHTFGDFSNWDGNQTRQLMWCFLAAANRYYNDEHSLLREMLFEEIFNSKHIFKNVVYELVGGMASGNPMTAILNSWDHQVLSTYIVAEICLEKGIFSDMTEIDLEHDFQLTVLGDDEVMSVSERLTFTPQDLQEHYARYGWTYTDEFKDSKMGAWRQLEEGMFLQRGFFWHPTRNRFVAPLNLTTILEMCCYTKTKDTTYDFVRSNLDKAYLELSLHPREVFARYEPVLRDMGYAIEHSSDLLDYDALSKKACSLKEADLVFF